MLDISALQNLRGDFTASNDGEIKFNSGITSISGCTITTDGVALDFANVTELVNTNLYAQSGGVLTFGKLTTAAIDGDNNTTWQATGANSKIEFTALTTLNNTVTDSFSGHHYIQAESGGHIDLSQLTAVNRANNPLDTRWSATTINNIVTRNSRVRN